MTDDYNVTATFPAIISDRRIICSYINKNEAIRLAQIYRNSGFRDVKVEKEYKEIINF